MEKQLLFFQNFTQQDPHSCLKSFTQKSPSQYHASLPFQLPLQTGTPSGLLLKYILFPESNEGKMGQNTMIISPCHRLEMGKETGQCKNDSQRWRDCESTTRATATFNYKHNDN